MSQAALSRARPLKQLTIYSDGACRGNPGPGGWSAVLLYKTHRKIISGAESPTTNNRMELLAAIRALRILKEPCEIEFFTDSQYVRNGITQWMPRWKLSGWATRNRQPVKNQDLWQALDSESGRHRIEWRWLKGHAGHPENEACDRAARAAIDQLEKAPV